MINPHHHTQAGMRKPDSPSESFIGYVETTHDALLLIHAARLGIIPRIKKKLNDSERRMLIKSGTVFISRTDESRIQRWTDGLQWSPSKVVGDFLEYHETIGHKMPSESSHGDSPTRSMTGKSSSEASLNFCTGSSDQGTFNLFKTGGLMKKTITVIVQESFPQGKKTNLQFMLRSYYTPDDIDSGKLKRPSDIMNLHVPRDEYRLQKFPNMEIATDGEPSRLGTREVLQGTISKLKNIQQNVSLTPDFLNLVRVVQGISEVVSIYYDTHDFLVAQAQKAGLFVVTLETKVSVRTFKFLVPGDSVIEGLTKCILSDELLSAYSSDKEFHREMNQVLELLIHKESRAQIAINLLEAWLNRAIDIL